MNVQEKIKKIKLLIKKYKQEIEDLKANEKIAEDRKIQSVCILREVTNDIELILNEEVEIKKGCYNCIHASYEMKFGELEFSYCYLDYIDKTCEWKLKQ